MHRSFILYISLCACVAKTCGFNLEYRNPVLKKGEAGSYFGFSVALHKVGDGRDPNENWLLVGAPLGNNLQPQTNRSGALFKCSINSYNSNDCKQVVTDGKRVTSDYDDLDDPEELRLKPPENDEIKNGQWLGVTVKSQGPKGKILVCAHRYIVSPNLNLTHHGLGLCYVLQNDFMLETEVEPCKGRPVKEEHQQFGYCQAGTSSVLMEDGTAVIGSPGPFTWRGTLFVQAVGGSFLNRNKNVYLGPLSDKPEPIEKYSYLGMSVAAGNFYGNGTVYAAGAPRSMEAGQVYIFAKKSAPNDLELEFLNTINGEQFASSFGYELCTADVNNDNVTDLIVGAPFYFNNTVGGKVYVYTNLKSCTTNCTADRTLTGPVDSRFGFAIANLGDINKDGYDDIAIGAPYDKNGAVYIYLGSANGLMTTPSQIIQPESKYISTVGYSLSGGMDMDNNGYPDLLVGAYESDTVLLFKSRPIFDILITVDKTELSNIDVNKRGCKYDRRSKNTCFSFKTCCRIHPLAKKSRAIETQLKYVVEAETFEANRKYSRVFFRTETANQVHSSREQYFFINADAEKCISETVYLKNETRDILSSIRFRVNFSLANDTEDSPILNQQKSVEKFEATFQKDCGDDDICQSKMVLSARLLSLPEHESKANTYILTVGNVTEMSLEINVNNLEEPAYEAQLFVNHSTDLSYIGQEKLGQVYKCNFKNEALVACSLGNPFKPNEPLNIKLRFEPKQEISSQFELTFNISVNSTSKETSDKTNVILKAAVEKKAEVKILGAATVNILYGGEIKGESAMQYFDDIGTRVWHTYQVINEGPGQAENVIVYIDWPWQVANNKDQGKWLLYLEAMPSIEGGQQCEAMPGTVNPLGLTARPGQSEQETPPDNLIASPLMSTPSTRRKRDAEMVIKSETIEVGGQKREIVTMECDGKRTAKCVKFMCRIPKLMRNGEATIKIRSRLWNSTLVEDYPRVYWVGIKSMASIHINDTSVKQSLDDDFTWAETRAYPDLEQQEAEPVPLWIYIVAILVGLIILILLAFILYKCGFFKRQRPDQTLSGNLEKSKEVEPLVSPRNK